MPIICTFQVLLQKHVTVDKKVDSTVFAFGTYMFFCAGSLIAGIVNFGSDHSLFTWDALIFGGIGALGGMLGSYFCTAAISTDA
jgi:hypothetical protein